MACLLCENNYGMSLCECTYLMCRECINNLEFPKCPHCQSILNIKLFIAGKMVKSDNNKPNEYTRRFVCKNEYREHNIGYLTSVKGGDLEIKDEDIIDYDEFINIDHELHVQQITPTTAITGPYIIFNDTCVPNHGYWQASDYLHVEPISDIVNKRNHEAINNCDVFVLELNYDYDCYRSIAEWGIASALGKILIILFPDENKDEPQSSEFYMFAAESIKSLDTLSFTKKEAIFTSHPIFDITYKQYEKRLQNIISKKQHN